jgi:hypothetical protein
MNETISFVQSYLSGHAIQTRRQRVTPYGVHAIYG